MVKVSSPVIATAALSSFTTAISTIPASAFVSSDAGISFALNIPQTGDSNDLYFSLSGSASSSWIAVGMGSSNMANSLTFMLYADSTGKSVTLSPRLVYGEVEPEYTSNITISVLPGSGIANDTMTVNAMCTGCRSWKGGSVDPTDTAAQFIFAVGPDGDLNSDNNRANVKRHAEYGSFTMDLTRALGDGGVPAAVVADTAGTTQNSMNVDHEVSIPLHAFLMISAFVVLMPFGVMVLRIFNSPKWHGINQALSTILALIGVALGICVSTMYNRSKSFNSAHQIFGFIITAALLIQLIFGLLHHRQYKATQSASKLSPPHIWLGRLVIICGIINSFLGFPLALNPKYNYALVTLVVLIVISMGPFAFWRYKRDDRKKMEALSTDLGGTGYQAQPWLGAGSAAQSEIQLGSLNGYPTHGYPTYYAPEQGSQLV